MGDGFQTRVVHLLQKAFRPIHPPISSLALPHPPPLFSLFIYPPLSLPTLAHHHPIAACPRARDNDSGATSYSREYTRIGVGFVLRLAGVA